MSLVEVLETPIKSEADKKSYRLIRLENGLKALLIMENEDSENGPNEKSQDIAAAQLAVNVGSFDDPPHAMGLAHFLEHMVHMGSEKYPNENSFNEILMANSGADNAITTSEYTAFFFNITEKAFPKALDIFAQQFISPLLLKEAMQREREAVDSEYQMALANNLVLAENIYKNLIYETHPASKFDCGNLKSLKENISDDDLHSELLKLHRKYVGNKMYLVVQSKQSLDDLQEIVVKSFSGIRRDDNFDEKLLTTTINLEDIFKQEFYSKIYFMKSKGSVKSLIMCWTLPSIHKFYKCSPLDYITHIFSRHGEGGLSNYLKERLLITHLSFYVHANSFGGNSQFCLPRLILRLTELGYQNIETVLEAVFSYLLMMKETSIDDHRALYNDLKENSEVEFRYKTETSAINNVRSLISSMMLYDDCDILRGTSVYQMFDEGIISEHINFLNEKKINFLIFNKDHEKFSKKEKYFGVDYDDQDFPEAYQKLWDERKLNSEFFLEKSNPFKAKNFEIFVNADESPKFPTKIFENEIYEVWHKLDAKFKTPRAVICIQFLSPKIISSVQSWIYFTIYNAMLNRYLKKTLHQAFAAGLTLSANDLDKSFVLSFSGFNDKLLAIFEMSMQCLKDYNEQMEESVFEAIRFGKKQGYYNRLLQSGDLSSGILKKAIISDFYSDLDIYKALETISFENFKIFMADFFRKIKTEVLVQGNMQKSEALKIVGILESKFNFEPLDETYELMDRSYQMPLGASILRIKSLMPNDDNSKIKNYYHIGPDTLRVRCLTRMIVSILDPKAFDYLRTKEQLGYSVGCRFNDYGQALGLVVSVSSQEHKHPFSEVSSKLETFMNSVATKAVEELTDEDFENLKQSRVKLLLADHSSLTAEASANWAEIKDHEHVFNRRELAAEIIKNITKAELQDFFKSFTQPNNKRLLSVQVIGSRTDEENSTQQNSDLEIEILTDKLVEDENLITNIEEFQSKLFLYPFSKFEI